MREKIWILNIFAGNIYWVRKLLNTYLVSLGMKKDTWLVGLQKNLRSFLLKIKWGLKKIILLIGFIHRLLQWLVVLVVLVKSPRALQK